MKVGDLIKWVWYLSSHEKPTPFQGLVVSIHGGIAEVLIPEGEIVSLRKDFTSVEVISESR